MIALVLPVIIEAFDCLALIRDVTRVAVHPAIFEPAYGDAPVLHVEALASSDLSAFHELPKVDGVLVGYLVRPRGKLAEG